MSHRLKFWLGLSAFAVVYLALRVFWLSGDPGIPAIWEYGYNAIVLCRVAVALAVWPDAQRAGVTVWEVVRRTTTHYPLPSLWDFASHFRGLSAFPRVPSYALLGVTTAFAVILPAILFLRRVAGGRLNGNTLLFAAVPAYVAAINVMNTQYTHYFLPALMLLPIVTDAAVDELTADGADVTAFVWRKMLPALGLSVAACAVGLLFLASWQVSPQDAQPYYSRIYNFPAQNVWGLTWPVLMVFVAAVVAALLLLCGPRGLARNLPVWTVSAFVAASVVFAALPAVHLAPALRQDAGLAFAPLAVVLIVSVVLLIAVFGLRAEIPWRSALAPFALLSVAVCYLATPNWRQSAAELVKAPTHFHARAAQELKAVLPADAIVIGERSNQMLMSLPIRTATTFAANSDPIPVIRSILKANPNAKLYALADSQHAYNLQHYRKHANEYALRLLKTLKMPSFGTGAPADVYLCKIEVLPSDAN